MIKSVFANQDSFRTVEFSSGFNVVVADNGVGKSTLIEIIHFCLGSGITRNKGLVVEALAGWEFSIELLIDGQTIIATRCVDEPGIVLVKTYPVDKNSEVTFNQYRVNDWITKLGGLFFGLPVDSKKSRYSPTFRSLISYFIRRGKDAFSNPLEHHRLQMTWNKQVSNAYLLGLDWQIAAEMQELREWKKAIQDFERASKAGVVGKEMETLVVMKEKREGLKAKSAQEKIAIKSFEEQTEEINALINANDRDRRLIKYYERDLSGGKSYDAQNIKRIYEEAGVVFPELTLRKIEKVQDFHNQIVQNHREYLNSEVQTLKQNISYREELTNEKINNRSKSIEFLQLNGKHDEYSFLQDQYMRTIKELYRITVLIEYLSSFEDNKLEFSSQMESWKKKAIQAFSEKQGNCKHITSLFDDYSGFIYGQTGQLKINIDDNGFRFDIGIKHIHSEGIRKLNVFCYDLMLANLWAHNKPSPNLLIHDSAIFDGVDERCLARALEVAARESKANGFQYICILNSDSIPTNELSDNFNIKQYIKLRLTDKSIDGCLLGKRF